MRSTHVVQTSRAGASGYELCSRSTVLTASDSFVSALYDDSHMNLAIRSSSRGLTALIAERLALAREQRAKIGHQRFTDGYRAAMETLGRRPKTPWEQHPQTTLNGIEVDEKIAPLLNALWNLGFETHFSCEGDSRDYIADEVGTDDALAYIAFATLEQSVRFITTTVILLDRVPWEDGRLMCGPMAPQEDEVIRGSAHFPPSLLNDITRAWMSHAVAAEEANQ